MLHHLKRLVFVVCFTAPSWAQVDRATLSGTVSDASGAKVEAAKVSVGSVATGFMRETRASSSGAYQIPGLPVGSYTVTVAKEGFKTLNFDAVVLTVGQSRTLDVQLTVGAVSSAIDEYGSKLLPSSYLSLSL